jgi:hypothetical protein
MKAARSSGIVLTAIIVCLIPRPASAGEPRGQGRSFSIGHFTVSVPEGWNSLPNDDKDKVRRDFSANIAPGLRQYERAGGPTPRMGEFEILQKPTDAQLLAWTLVIPDQHDFLGEILKRESVQFDSRKSWSGGRLKGGLCRLVRVGGVDVVRVDVEMANGGKTTNLHYWSSTNPGIISTLMIGVRPNRTPQTDREFESMISSLVVNEEIKK